MDLNSSNNPQSHSNSSNLEAKYQKLAAEYAKLRAQAKVLKNGVLEEQNKSSALRETLRQKEVALRRAEQEIDCVAFRNKQLEHRVATLQDDIENEIKKSSKSQKSFKFSFRNISSNDVTPSSTTSTSTPPASTDAVILEELQKKIIENAQLTSLIDDKNREIILQDDRIRELERQIEKRNLDVIEVERRLRKDIDTLTARNSELETKLVEAASMLGSEDALSASGSDNTPLHTINSTSSEERIAFLEKEVFHWRTQYEILKIGDLQPFDRSKQHHQHHQNTIHHQQHQQQKQHQQNGPSSAGSESEISSSENHKEKLPKEEILYNHFSKKFEDLLREKCMAESRLTSYLTECEHLQSNAEFLNKQLTDKEHELKSFSRIIQTLEEDLASTRINYEEQISVLTEQVISLSEQLASSK